MPASRICLLLLILGSSLLVTSPARALPPTLEKTWNALGYNQSSDIAVSPDNSEVYVSTNAGILKIDVSLDDPVAATVFVAFGTWESVAFDASGVLWGALEQSSMFIGFDATGTPVDTITTPVPLGHGNGTSIAFGPSGTMYATIASMDNLWKLTDPNSSWTVLATVSGAALRHIAVNDDEHVYVTGSVSDRVYKYDGISGTLITDWGGTGSANGQFDAPNGIAVGPDSLVHVTGRVNDRIQTFDPDGTWLETWGVGDYTDSPYGIDVDDSNNFFVTECCQTESFLNDVLMYTIPPLPVTSNAGLAMLALLLLGGATAYLYWRRNRLAQA